MKIRMVRLQNIKSYVDETIYFNDGVNFISGVNGAGKTSIIESIGLALFDSKPGINSEFIRYGQKTGIITVEFEANDSRIYRVVRKIGNTNSWQVYDAETGSELNLYNASDIKPWLKDVLGIPQDQDLTQLFEDIIGVGQGMFTAPFLERPAERKIKFNKMLKVEAYREAGDRIRSVLRELDESVAALREARAEKEGSIRDYDALVEERSRLIPVISEIEKELDEKKTELDGWLKERDELRRLEKEIDRASKNIQIGETKIASLKDAISKLNTGLASAREASVRVEASSEGYYRYISAEKEMEKLEQQRAQRDEILRQLNDCRQKEAEIRSMITAGRNAGEEEEKNLAAETQYIALQKAVAIENGSLERELLAEAEQSLAEVDSFDSYLVALESLISETDRVKTRVDAALEQWKTLNQRISGLKKSISEEPVILSGLKELEAVENEIESLKRQKNILEEKIKVLEENREKTKGGRCPFLDAECRNIEGSLDSYFDRQLKESRAALSGTVLRLQNLEKDAQQKADLRKLYIKLENEKEMLEEAKVSSERLLSEIKVQLEVLQRCHNEMNSVPGTKQNTDLRYGLDKMFEVLKPEELSYDLQRSRDECLDRLDSFNASWQLLNVFIEDLQHQEFCEFGDITEKITVLLEKGHELLKKLKKIQGDVKRVLEKRASEHRTRLAGYDREIELLVKSENDLAMRKRKLKERIRSLEEKQTELLKVGAAGREMETKLSAFSKLDEMIRAIQKKIEDNREAYDTYIKYQVEAEKVKELERELSEKLLLLEKEKAVIAENKMKLDELTPLYSSERLEAAEQKVEILNREITAREGTLTERKKDFQEYTQRIAAMEKIKKEIETLNHEIKKSGEIKSMLEYIRSILNRAGERVAAVYREHLAREANRIYRDISKENVMVEWKDDYEIVLLDMLNGRQRQRCFRQLSGGEQMTAALAMRLSFLKQLSRIGIGFFDEPTTNLDGERRSNLVRIIPQVTDSFDQLFIISHDDSFDAMTENTIQLIKDSGEGTKLA